VRVRFHGSLTKGWVLGRATEIPPRVTTVDRLVSPERFFDEELLALARWIAERYVAPLAAVLDRLAPPRVAGEEEGPAVAGSGDEMTGDVVPRPPAPSILHGYREGPAMLELCRVGTGAMTLRPAPEDEQAVAVEAVAACVRGGRRAIVVVPEATPLPATAAAVRDAFGDRAVVFAGGDRRSRYRTWRAIRAGAADVVVGTRPAVFAPLRDLGLLFVSRESHPAHREDRAPYHHVREVALARGRLSGGAVVLSALCRSAEADALGLRDAAPARRSWPVVEVVRPAPQGRAGRLAQALAMARRGFIFVPTPGAGTAQVCRTCGAAAACAACGGVLREEAGELRCVVCRALGRCGSCGGDRFAIRPGGSERVTAWASRHAAVPVHEVKRPRAPRAREVLVGGPDDVRDLEAGGLDLVAIVDADASARRPGLAGRERTLSTWMEAAGWARPSGRVIVQSTQPGDPIIQALVRGNPDRFLAEERRRRAEAGFPVDAAVFRVIGRANLATEVDALGPRTALISTLGDRTVCLLALEPERVGAFGDAMRRLAVDGAVERVEAEPHL
jgi:primosomal protein N' (replication factor Y) (superfamily II helicase)